MRLQKILAKAGYGSRRLCEDLIREGRVEINGAVAGLGARADPESDRIAVDGAPVGTAEALVYLLLNKPRGVISTVRDTHGRPTVTGMVEGFGRLSPVGRLDAESEGLMILTNDGELANFLTHPAHHVEKEYLVALETPVSRRQLAALRGGVADSGEILRAKRIGQLGERTVRVVLTEGRNRQIRRMMAGVGLTVRQLVRVRIGPLSDGDLRPGEYRPLSAAELVALRKAGGYHLEDGFPGA